MSKHEAAIRHAARHHESGSDRIRRDPRGSRNFEAGKDIVVCQQRQTAFPSEKYLTTVESSGILSICGHICQESLKGHELPRFWVSDLALFNEVTSFNAEPQATAQGGLRAKWMHWPQPLGILRGR